MASKKWKKIPNITNYDNMLHSRNIYKTALSSAKQAYYISKVNNLSSDIGGLYSFMNKLLYRKSKLVHYPDMSLNLCHSTATTLNLVLVQLFNLFYVSAVQIVLLDLTSVD